MYNKYPQFFQNEKQKSLSVIQFTNIIKTPSSHHNLYRGFTNLSSVMFSMPALLTGIFGKTYPEAITIEEIKLHKLTNLSNDYHMVSMSEDPQIALEWGDGYFITIDPTLFRNFTVDVHETYRKNNLNLPGRMEREKEHVALAVPYCCIKKITIKNKEIANPFYLAISNTNQQEALHEFNSIYCQLLSLLRNKYSRELDNNEEKLALREHVTTYLRFYDKYSGVDNPFNKTLQELSELHPEFMNYFFQFNPQHTKSGVMKDSAIISSDTVFQEHYYTQSIDSAFLYRHKEATTCYEDEWARPTYD